MANAPKDANELIDEIIAGPNPLDKFMRLDPKQLVPERDYPAMVSVLRRDRALFIKAQAAKKDKKAGVLVEDPAPDTEETEQ